MSAGYRTVLALGEDEVIINKSRFIGSASPAPTEEAALAFLKEIKEKYRDASHHCYAYVVGENSGVMRYSDDGEPGGTAGMPIIEGLKKRGLTNLCVVVTRYFGGVLLGAGGLTRAYGKGCSIAVAAARPVLMEPTVKLLCDCPYPLWDRVQHMLASQPVRLESTDFTSSVSFTALARTKDRDAFIDALRQRTDGRAEAAEIEECFLPWEIPEE